MAESGAGNVRARSPESTTGNDKKRRRKVLSCYDCRRRKLQCDRVMPACGRCVKAGQAANCLYIDDPSDARPEAFDGHISRPIQPPTASGDLLSRLEFQDRRIKQLEAALAETAGQSNDSAPRNRTLPVTPCSLTLNHHVPANGALASVTDRETMLLRGKSFKTQFLGSTHPSGQVAHLPDLNQFTKEIFEKNPGLFKIRMDLKSLDECLDRSNQVPAIPTTDDLKRLLPTREETDIQVQLYFDTYGAIYHILHLPNFWKEYSDLWDNLSTARPHFIALILAILATVQCLATSTDWMYMAGSSKPRDKAVFSIQVCENWIQNQSQKHVTATDFQIRVLIQLGKIVCARKFKRTWTETGTLVRFCMGAGLHRSPDLIRKRTSNIDKELRRRIWMTAIELELQAALDRGSVPVDWPAQSDTSPPSNFDDEQLEAENDVLQPPRPITTYTSASFLSQAGESMSLRHMLTTLLNSIRQTLTFNDVKRFTDEIQTQIDAIPAWKNSGTAADVSSAMLSLILRQYLLIIHDRHVRQAETMTERNLSRMILIDTATSIIQTHRFFFDRNIHALQVLCQDQIRAALSIVFVAVTTPTRLNAPFSTINSTISTAGMSLLDDVVEMLTDKVLRFGREQRQLWITLAAQSYWKARLQPAQKNTYMSEAVDKVTQPYYKIMACQEQLGPMAITHAHTATKSSKDTTSTRPEDHGGTLDHLLNPLPMGKPRVSLSDEKTGHVTPGMAMDGILGGHDPPLLDLDELAEWTFDDWSISPGEVHQAFAMTEF